jgi:hypothetical protein
MKFYIKQLLQCALNCNIIEITGRKIALGTKNVQGEFDEGFNSASKEDFP